MNEDKMKVTKRTGCFSLRTMTLNLPESEMEILEALAIKRGMNKTAICKQALRLYAYLDEQRQRGRKLYCQMDKKLTEIFMP